MPTIDVWGFLGLLATALLSGVGGGFLYRFYALYKIENRADELVRVKAQEFLNEQSREQLAERSRQIARGLSRLGAMEEAMEQVREQQTKLVIRVAQLEFEARIKDADIARLTEENARLKEGAA